MTLHIISLGNEELFNKGRENDSHINNNILVNHVDKFNC